MDAKYYMLMMIISIQDIIKKKSSKTMATKMSCRIFLTCNGSGETFTDNDPCRSILITIMSILKF